MSLSSRRTHIVNDIEAQCRINDQTWGNNSHPHYTGPRESLLEWHALAHEARLRNQDPGSAVTWESILLEEVFESLAEPDWAGRRHELIQCAAVIIAEIADGDVKAQAEVELTWVSESD